MTLFFTNPITASAYRLRADLQTWRIIKSRTMDRPVVIRNLAGIDGDHDVDPHLLDMLVRGDKCIPMAVGNALRAFTAIILLDLDRTCDYVLALARDAEERSRRGYPGFRSHSPQLRRDAVVARRTAMQACRRMAKSWEDAKLAAATPLPEWLVAALSDSTPEA